MQRADVHYYNEAIHISPGKLLLQWSHKPSWRPISRQGMVSGLTWSTKDKSCWETRETWIGIFSRQGKTDNPSFPRVALWDCTACRQLPIGCTHGQWSSLRRSHGSHRHPKHQPQPTSVNQLTKKTQIKEQNLGWGYSTPWLSYHSRWRQGDSPIHCWHCPPDKAAPWCLTFSPFSVTFLLQDWKVLTDCSKSQVAPVLLWRKHWDLDPKYFVFEDAVGFGLRSLTFLPISDMIQNQGHFLVCCSHSHRTSLEAEYRVDHKKINGKPF